jgi:hypothetical protein
MKSLAKRSPKKKIVSNLRDFQYPVFDDVWHTISLTWIKPLQITVPAGKPVVMSTSLKCCKFTKNPQTFLLINLWQWRRHCWIHQNQNYMKCL